jgi:hypothetical protein
MGPSEMCYWRRLSQHRGEAAAGLRTGRGALSHAADPRRLWLSPWRLAENRGELTDHGGLGAGVVAGGDLVQPGGCGAGATLV